MSFDPKEFWKQLNLKRKAKALDFSKTDLYNYFKKLDDSDMDKSSNDLYNNIVNDNQKNAASDELIQLRDLILNSWFTLEEMKLMISKLKTGTASGIDRIIAELLKTLLIDDYTLLIMINILNKIFESEEFLEELAVRVIVILFKGGERDIRLLSIVGKLLVGMLNERLN